MQSILRKMSLLLSCFLLSSALSGQSNIEVQLNFTACEEPPKLYSFNGFSFDEITSAQPTGTENSFTLSLPASEPRFYYIGRASEGVMPILLGKEEGVVITGSCSNPRRSEVTGSELNRQYQQLKSDLNGFQQRFSRQLMGFRQAKTSEEKDAALAEMRQLDQEKVAFLDSLRSNNPLFARIAALNTYLSFFNNNNGRYKNELEYFAKEYFHFADFSQNDYNQLPWVYESFQSYTRTLSTVGLPDELHRQYLEQALSEVPAGSDARQLAYAGALNFLEQRNHANYVHFAESFIREYPDVAAPARQHLEQKLAQVRAFAIGGTAPDFSQQTPEGEELKLSDLRGKVVLVDFWASWCGPCRRENPNVVRVYDKYKEKGFEILGVSLDQNRDNWLKAIEKDGLTWHHVSDLKGWKNEVAQQYSVRSIPHTILLDEEGKIIARNLRGPALEKKLEELFD